MLEGILSSHPHTMLTRHDVTSASSARRILSRGLAPRRSASLRETDVSAHSASRHAATPSRDANLRDLLRPQAWAGGIGTRDLSLAVEDVALL